MAISYRISHYFAFSLERMLLARQHFLKIFQKPLFHSQEYMKMKKLNLACSDRIIPGWVNVDARNLPGVDHVIDIRDLSIFPDASFDILRASHVIEHFYLDELDKILKEWSRVLKPGGWMIVCAPSFDLTILRYFVNPQSINPLLTPEFGTAILSQIYGFGYRNTENPFYKHRMVYNRKSLEALLKQFAGLKNLREFNFLNEEPFTLGIIDDSTNVYSLNLAGQK